MNAEKFTQKTIETINEAQNLARDHGRIRPLRRSICSTALLSQWKAVWCGTLIYAYRTEIRQHRYCGGNARRGQCRHRTAFPKVSGGKRRAVSVEQRFPRSCGLRKRPRTGMKDEYISVEHIMLGLLSEGGQSRTAISAQDTASAQKGVYG